jgi:hypothetical protein
MKDDTEKENKQAFIFSSHKSQYLNNSETGINMPDLRFSQE